jgi:hypothetical protein
MTSDKKISLDSSGYSPKRSNTAAFPVSGKMEGMADASDPKDQADREHDIVLFHSRTEDGQGLRALRSRPGRLESAEIRPVKQGKPIGAGEVVKLLPRKESPLLWDVDIQYAPESSESAEASGHAGPARYSSRAYRNNWSTVFGKGKTKAKKSNKKELLN